MPNVINKVVYNGSTLIDLTADTVDSNYVLSGYTFHKKNGQTATGACTYDADTSDATANAAEILNTKTAYVAGAKVTGSMPNRGAVTGSITSYNGAYTIPAGYHDGSGTCSINSTDQALLADPSNIAEGVTILGTTGTHSGTVPTQSKTFTPTASGATVTPDSGYNLYQVVVNPVPYTETLNASGGYTATIL